MILSARSHCPARSQAWMPACSTSAERGTPRSSISPSSPSTHSCCARITAATATRSVTSMVTRPDHDRSTVAVSTHGRAPSRRSLALPIFQGLTEAEQVDVVGALKHFVH